MAGSSSDEEGEPSSAPSDSEEEYSASGEGQEDEGDSSSGEEGGEEEEGEDAGGGGAAAQPGGAEDEDEDVAPTQAQLEERRQENIRAMVSGAGLEVRRAALLPRLLTVQQVAVVLRRPFKSPHPDAPAMSAVRPGSVGTSMGLLCACLRALRCIGCCRASSARPATSRPKLTCCLPARPPAGPEAQAGCTQGICALGRRQVCAPAAEGASKGAASGRRLSAGRRQRRGAAAGRGAAAWD